MVYIVLAVVLYKSKPWKRPIWRNKILSFFLCINIIGIVLISFFTSSLEDWKIQSIGLIQVGVIWAIMIVSGLICAAYNMILERVCFRSRNIDRLPNYSSFASMQ